MDKIIADLSVMNADMTDEEHADAMASLLLLRDEARYALSDVLNDFMSAQRRRGQSEACGTPTQYITMHVKCVRCSTFLPEE